MQTMLALTEQINAATQRRIALQDGLASILTTNNVAATQTQLLLIKRLTGQIDELTHKRGTLMRTNEALAATEDNINALTMTSVQTYGAYRKAIDKLTRKYEAGEIALGEYMLKAQNVDAVFIKQEKTTDKVLSKQQQYIASLAFQNRALDLSAETLAVENALRKLGADATEDQRDKVAQLTREYVRLSNEKSDQKLLEKLIEKN